VHSIPRHSALDTGEWSASGTGTQRIGDGWGQTQTAERESSSLASHFTDQSIPAVNNNNNKKKKKKKKS